MKISHPVPAKLSLVFLGMLCGCLLPASPPARVTRNLVTEDLVEQWLAEPVQRDLRISLRPEHSDAKMNLTGAFVLRNGKIPQLPDTILPLGLSLEFKKTAGEIHGVATASMTGAYIRKIIGPHWKSRVVSSDLRPTEREWSAQRISFDQVRNIVRRAIAESHGRVDSIGFDTTGRDPWIRQAKLLSEGFPSNAHGSASVSWDGAGIQPTVELTYAKDGTVIAQLTGVRDAILHLSSDIGKQVENNNQAIPANMPVYALALKFSSTDAAMQLFQSRLGSRKVCIDIDFGNGGFTWRDLLKDFGQSALGYLP